MQAAGPSGRIYKSHILAFDTSGLWLSAALMGDRDIVYDSDHVDMARGQAEALMPLLENLLDRQKLNWADLEALAVGVGPGNFTGIRISVSAARGLSMALGIPAIGVSSFEAMLWQNPGPLGGPARLISLPAPQGKAYGQIFRDGTPQGEPQLIDPSEPPQELQQVNLSVEGHHAEDIAKPFGARVKEISLRYIAANIAKAAANRLDRNEWDGTPPAPLYIRPPDAAPPRDPAPVILDA